MKLLTLIELYKILDVLFQKIKSDRNYTVNHVGNLSSGRAYVLRADRVYTYIELSDNSWMMDFIKLTDITSSNQLYSALRDDIVFRYPTTYARVITNGIYRETTGTMYKAPNTFPFLGNVELTEDVLEPLIFQLSTQYTFNEVNSMVLAKAFDPSNEQRDHYPFISLDFRAFDKLTNEELSELTSLITEFIA